MIPYTASRARLKVETPGSNAMADFHAIQTTCDAIMRLLQESYRPDLIEPLLNLQFEVYGTDDFKSHMTQGVSLFLYRVYVNATQRAPLTKSTEGNIRRQLLPLDLHFFSRCGRRRRRSNMRFWVGRCACWRITPSCPLRF